ncbi:MAG: LacI family transcriptional regulator [Defluviitaleaceae bacterium]|nr:LacI family transcriptional regulator [Defluviitaleaceae bacterium]
MKYKRVSSKDVAREAGVSQATVSYVLNNNPNVKIRPETRQKVMDAAKDLNYHVNYIARNMRLRKSTCLGIVTDIDMSSNIFLRALEGIKDAVVPRNYSLSIGFGAPEDISDAEYIKYYYSNLIDGLIFVFCDLTDRQIRYLENNTIPYVLISSSQNQIANFQIKSDIAPALDEAVANLKASGITEIGFLGATAGDNKRVRFDAFAKVMEKNGLNVDKSLLFKIGTNENNLESEIAKALGKKTPRGLICDSLNAGFYGLRHLHKSGISLPNDVSLVMIGTTDFSQKTTTAISAVEAPLYDMGKKGADLLFGLIDNEIKGKEAAITLKWQFVKRETSK